MISCVRCEKQMKNFMEDDRGLQPIGGLAFSSHGHYGSAAFDPMDGSYLEIALCDGCLRDVERAGMVFRSRGDRA